MVKTVSERPVSCPDSGSSLPRQSTGDQRSEESGNIKVGPVLDLTLGGNSHEKEESPTEVEVRQEIAHE